VGTVIVPGIADAIAATDAMKIFVCNLMTEPGETDRFGLAAHLDALRAHGVPPEAFDYIVVNDAPIPAKMLARYASEGAEPVKADVDDADGPQIVGADLLARGPVARHDDDKVGRFLCELTAPDARERTRWTERSSRDRARPPLDPVPVVSR
jgi:uncharacterized cofD-like protein